MLYIHIPFCDSKCHYCAFNSFTTNHHLKNDYLQALLQQLRFELERFRVKTIETIFIGGGTPSTMPIDAYETIFTLLEPYIKQTKEITIEANPSAKEEWIEEIAQFVTRISFGVQSFDEAKLKFLGRAHTPKMAMKSIEIAAKAGIKHINLDLIYDCALDSKELLKKDIQIALSLPINHISAYALTLEEGTPFAGKNELKRDDVDLAYFVAQTIGQKLPQYEVSNFGTPSLHNLGYWKLKDYIGVGAGAVGFLKNRRFYPPADLHSYIHNPLAIEEELLKPADLRSEKIFLGLRSIVGVELSLLDPKRVNILLQEEKVERKEGRIYNKNLFLADEIALFLL